MEKYIINNLMEKDPAYKQVFFGTLEDLKNLIKYNLQELEKELDMKRVEVAKEALKLNDFKEIIDHLEFYNFNLFGEACVLEIVNENKSLEEEELYRRAKFGGE